MSTDKIFAIASAGMDLERLRVDVVANNLANQNTVADKNGNVFQPMQVEAIVRPTDTETLNQAIDVQFVPENVQPRMVYDPSNPHANKNGFVAHPGINSVDEMVTLLSAKRSYEADVKVFNTAKALAQYDLALGDKQ